MWNHAPAPDRVTVASNQIDRILERDPLSAGESREGRFRVLFEEPLGVTFEVNPTTGEVREEIDVQFRAGISIGL